MKKIILSALMLMGVISVTKAGDWNIYDSKVPLDSIVMESGRTWSKMEVEYENGKISCALSETMISGCVPEMLNQIRDISSDTLKDGSGSLPYVAFDGLTISGK